MISGTWTRNSGSQILQLNYIGFSIYNLSFCQHQHSMWLVLNLKPQGRSDHQRLLVLTQRGSGCTHKIILIFLVSHRKVVFVLEWLCICNRDFSRYENDLNEERHFKISTDCAFGLPRKSQAVSAQTLLTAHKPSSITWKIYN